MAHVLICCILKFPPVYCNVSSLLFSCIGLRDDRPSTSDCLFVVNVIHVYYNSLMSSSSAAGYWVCVRAVQRITDNNAAV